jgi:hypothetical protein
VLLIYLISLISIIKDRPQLPKLIEVPETVPTIACAFSLSFHYLYKQITTLLELESNVAANLSVVAALFKNNRSTKGYRHVPETVPTTAVPYV